MVILDKQRQQQQDEQVRINSGNSNQGKETAGQQRIKGLGLGRGIIIINKDSIKNNFFQNQELR